MRIISLCPSNTELLGFMGLDRYLVGVDDYSDWPSSIEGLPRLGSDLNIDINAVASLQPDLVVASLTVPGMEKNIAGLDERKLPYVTLNPKSLNDIADNLLSLGEALDEPERARAARQKFIGMLERYEELSRQCKGRPSLYWEWWPKPVYSPGGTNWLTEISRLAGAVNVFADKGKSSVKTEWDEVLRLDPDYILLAWVGIRKQLVKPESILERPGSERLSAVAKKRIHVMEESLFCRPSPLILAGLQKLACLLHPDVFPPYQDITREWLK